MKASGILAAVLMAMAGGAYAADVAFDGGGNGVGLLEGVRGVEVSAELPRPAPVAVPAGARVYDFKTLYGSLGYPSPDYFGSSEDEVADLETYTSKEDTYYKEVNDYLRFYPEPYDWYGISPESAKGMVKNMDRVFKRAPALPGDIILFRGLALKYHGNKPYAEGEEFTDKGFISTSTSYKVARYFAIEINDNATTPERKAVFAIYLGRQGEKGILVDQGEDEVILKHGMKFRVMARKDGVKKYDLYLVQACATVCDPVLRRDAAAFWSGFDVQD